MTNAPELLRRALDVGIDVGWEVRGGVYAQVTDRRSARQRAAFDALTANESVPAVLCGYYYAGFDQRWPL